MPLGSSHDRDPKGFILSRSARRALRVGLLDLAFLRVAQALFERREIEGLLQHDKALLHGIAGAVAVARCEQYRHVVIALAEGMPELEPGHSARHQDIREDNIDLRI